MNLALNEANPELRQAEFTSFSELEILSAFYLNVLD